MPIIEDKPTGKIPVNLTITSTKNPTTSYTTKTGQCNIELHNLTNGQHSVTIYYSYYDSIITDWRHFLPLTTINFSIDNTITPSSKPTPSIPEFPVALAVTFLVVLTLAIAFVVKRKSNLEQSFL
jgi:hypothetical protein